MKYSTLDILHLLPLMTAIMHEALWSFPLQKLTLSVPLFVLFVCLPLFHAFFVYVPYYSDLEMHKDFRMQI